MKPPSPPDDQNNPAPPPLINDPLQEDPLEFPDPDDDDDDDEMGQILRRHWSSIRTHHLVDRPIQDNYNFRLVGTRQLEPGVGADEALLIAFNNLRCRAKVNISFGLVLRHTVTGELRYFHSSFNNAQFFDEPFPIGSRDDLDRMLEALSRRDVEEFGRRQRSDTKWVLESMTNITIFVNKLKGFPIGAPVRDLPPHVANNHAVVNLVKNRRTGQRFNTDDLCFFRCLALWLNNDNHDILERDTKHLLETYRQATNDPEATALALDELTKAEDVFGLNIQVYTLVREGAEEGGDDEVEVFAQLVRRSPCRHQRTLYLNLHGKHFSFIKKIEMYSRSYSCVKCGYVTHREYNVRRHQRKCVANVKHSFPGGGYRVPPTIFEKLEDLGVHIEEENRYFPYRATFDFESYFQPVPERLQGRGKLAWERRHELLSCSVASNVPGLKEAQCFVTDGNSG